MFLRRLYVTFYSDNKSRKSIISLFIYMLLSKKFGYPRGIEPVIKIIIVITITALSYERAYRNHYIVRAERIVIHDCMLWI